MATANLDSADLKAASGGALIREDVMNQIWDISAIPLPFSDRCGSGSADNSYHEWTTDELAAVNLSNALIDGQDITGNDTKVGVREGNHCQISGKTVRVSTRADNSDTIGRDKELSYQLMQRQRELRRDREGILLSLQGSVADDGSAVAGKVGSVFSWIKTNVSLGATGTATGFNPTTKVTAAVTAGTKRGLTEKMVRDILQQAYDNNASPDTLMSSSAVIRKFSEYSFTSSARIATITSEAGQSEKAAVAKGAVNVWVTDFDIVLDLVPNRLQPHPGATASVGIFDFDHLNIADLVGVRVEEMAKTGLAENRMMTVDYTLEVLNEKSQAAIHGIDETIAVVPG